MVNEAFVHNRESEISLACFEVGGQSYALDVAVVREIVRSQRVTPLPNAPPLIEGVIELRGGLVPLLDLSRVLGGPRREISQASRIVVLETEGLQFGLCVDAATDVLSIDPANLEEVPDLASQAGYEVVRSVVRRPDASPVMVLAVETILEAVYRSSSESTSRMGENK